MEEFYRRYIMALRSEIVSSKTYETNYRYIEVNV